jgi:hypothetical protein
MQNEIAESGPENAQFQRIPGENFVTYRGKSGGQVGIWGALLSGRRPPEEAASTWPTLKDPSVAVTAAADAAKNSGRLMLEYVAYFLHEEQAKLFDTAQVMTEAVAGCNGVEDNAAVAVAVADAAADAEIVGQAEPARWEWATLPMGPSTAAATLEIGRNVAVERIAAGAANAMLPAAVVAAAADTAIAAEEPHDCRTVVADGSAKKHLQVHLISLKR